MKKIVLISLSVITFLSSIFSTHVKALDSKDLIFEEKINKSVIAGDGSFDNPYIVDPEKAPEFTKFLIETGRTVLKQMDSDELIDNGISTYAIEDFLDNNKKHSNQIRGGY